MADTPTDTSLPAGDSAFHRFQQRVMVEFWTKFDEWLARARSEPTSARTPRTLADLNRIDHELAEPGQNSTVDLVYELAGLCRSFIFGDVWAWAFLQRRQGSSAEEVMALVAGRTADTEAAVYDRKWRLGLSQLTRSAFDTWHAPDTEGVEWVEEAWHVVVEEAIADFVVSAMEPALTRWVPTSRLRSNSRVKWTEELERIGRFIVAVHNASGQRIAKQDIWQAAGYKDRREFQRFQIGKGTDTANERFNEILRMSPEDFLQLRKKHAKRPA